MRKLLVLLGAVRPSPAVSPEDVQHNATLARADELLMIVSDYQAADVSRRRRR